MEARKATFQQIVGGNNQFIIPVFQRDYAWGMPNWHRLWNDISFAGASSERDGHFVGCIVHVPDRTFAAMTSHLVIDGQQRLTTLNVLCAALRDHIKENPLQSDGTIPPVDILEQAFVANNRHEGEQRYKVLLRRSDDEALRAVVDGKSLDNLEGTTSILIAECYRYFRRMLNSPETDIDLVYRGMSQLRLAEIELDRNSDDPQGVFESLNSTGVPLTPGDLIRNYLLMGLAVPEQTRLYEEYWHRTESLFRGNDGKMDNGALNLFLRDYITLRQKAPEPVQNHLIYERFKEFRVSHPSPVETVLDDIRRCAGYCAGWNGRVAMPSRRLTEAMRNLRNLGNTTGVLVMRLYGCYEDGTLSESDFAHGLRLIESYILRHRVCNRQIRSYPGIFARMARAISDEAPAESLLSTLAEPRGSYGFWSFPSDGEFARVLQERNLYGLQMCAAILARLENEGEREASPVGNYSIEHIMPQTLTKEWQDMLGEGWEQVHENWLHRLGNLTLTGFNSEYSNSSFEVKKTRPNGFNESAVRLNLFVRNQSEWTATQMEERGKLLAQRALRIWPYPRAS